MKKEWYSVIDNNLVCDYETYSTKKGRKVFYLKKFGIDNKSIFFDFYERGTKYKLTGVVYDNLVKCYIPLHNNTNLSGFISCDLRVLLNNNIVALEKKK